MHHPSIPWDRHHPSRPTVGQRLRHHHGVQVLEVERRLHERVVGEARIPDQLIDVGLVGEVVDLVAAPAQGVDVGQRRPHEVLHTSSLRRRNRRAAMRDLVRAGLPEGRHHERAIRALERSGQRLGPAQIRLHHLVGVTSVAIGVPGERPHTVGAAIHQGADHRAPLSS